MNTKTHNETSTHFKYQKKNQHKKRFKLFELLWFIWLISEIKVFSSLMCLLETSSSEWFLLLLQYFCHWWTSRVFLLMLESKSCLNPSVFSSRVLMDETYQSFLLYLTFMFPDWSHVYRSEFDRLFINVMKSETRFTSAVELKKSQSWILSASQKSSCSLLSGHSRAPQCHVWTHVYINRKENHRVKILQPKCDWSIHTNMDQK